MRITTEQTTMAIDESKTNKSTGPDDVNIHLKYLGPRAITLLTGIYNNVIQKNSIPNISKLAKIIPLHKLEKPINQWNSYRQFSAVTYSKNAREDDTSNNNSNIHDINTDSRKATQPLQHSTK